MEEVKPHRGFSPKSKHNHQPLIFPKDFLWGSSTSSHQVEGWNHHNDWWEWEHLPGKIAGGQMSGRASDHYHLYKDDFNLLERLGQNSHRLSIEWSRIYPEQGKFNQSELDHYIEVLKDLKGRGLTTMVTLHHFTNPLWFSNLGGFEKKKNIRFFMDYVNATVRALDPYTDLWCTINEPNVYTVFSFLVGDWPPGKTSVWSARKVYKNLAKAHKLSYELIHKVSNKKNVQVGIANNVTSLYSYNKHSLIDWLFVRIIDWLWNHYFMSLTEGYHDYLGVNYYVFQRVKGSLWRNWRDLLRPRPEGRELADLDWEIFPPGIFDAMIDMKDYRLPIYITENGISTLNDDKRARYIVSYLKEIYHAIQFGIDIKGYFYWSLLDNFEWDKGLGARFGLIDVDYISLERKVKPSAYIYKQICESNEISHDLLRFIGHSQSPQAVPASDQRHHEH